MFPGLIPQRQHNPEYSNVMRGYWKEDKAAGLTSLRCIKPFFMHQALRPLCISPDAISCLVMEDPGLLT